MPNMIKKGLSLIEIMIVVTIGVIILLPTINFMVSTQKTAYKGFDKLETLAGSRVIMEKVCRDLKNLCTTKYFGFTRINNPPKVTYVFPSFPVGNLGGTTSTKQNPVNIITYIFDSQKKTLIKSIKVHPALQSLFKDGSSEMLGNNVASFSISRKVMLGASYFDINVKCQSNHPQRKESATHLRTAVRSEFEVLKERHPAWIINRQSQLSLPQ